MGISKEERLRRKREAEKKRRERIKNNAELLANENEKRRKRYAVKKEQQKKSKKKESTKTITARRLKWRNAKRKYFAKKRAEKVIDTEVRTSVVKNRNESRRRIMKAKAKSLKVKHYSQIKKLEKRNATLQTAVNRYKVRCHRLQLKISKISNSPQSKLDTELKNNKLRVSPEVRRRLLFKNAVLTDVKQSFRKIRKTKDKNVISGHITLKYVKKYGFLSVAKPFFPFHSFQSYSKKRVFGVKRRKMDLVSKMVCNFFEDDEVSIISPAKADQIVRKGIKKQKRYLKNSLKYLFQKFCETSTFVISYGFFCKLRPFWVVPKAVNSRDTCLCVKCENARLCCESLHRLRIVKHKNIDELLENEVLCSPSEESCWFQECENCKKKSIEVSEFSDEECYYDAWVTKKNEENQTRTTKERIYTTTKQLVSLFFDTIDAYLKHRGNDRHQKRQLKQLKKNLTDTDLLVHVDFSENYACKYAREVQSIHFGGNREHISLHTGVLYVGKQIKSFCTISPDLKHDPTAIFLHLKPILEEYFDGIKNVHFLSDSPSTQYRNRHMFFIILKKLIPLFKNLETLTWNFSEAGHGKGAPDGIGATLKRTCDRIVAENKDVSNFETFSQCISKINKIKVVTIPSVSDVQLTAEIRELSVPVKGTMKVHQVKWMKTDKSSLYFNELSCFTCPAKCDHFHLRKVIYHVEPKNAEPVINEPNKVKPNEIVHSHETAEWKEGDWVVVKFNLEQTTGERRWIGKILRVNENDTYLVTFLRAKCTNHFAGYIYTYPQVVNEENVYKTQILYRIPPPEKFQRSLKFSVHCSTL